MVPIVLLGFSDKIHSFDNGTRADFTNMGPGLRQQRRRQYNCVVIFEYF
jgi:hypothetical protein